MSLKTDDVGMLTLTLRITERAIDRIEKLGGERLQWLVEDDVYGFRDRVRAELEIKRAARAAALRAEAEAEAAKAEAAEA